MKILVEAGKGVRWGSGVKILVEVGGNVGGKVGGNDSGGAGERTSVDVVDESGGSG